MSTDASEEQPTVIGVDVGGTFTDVVLLADGELTTLKVPTTKDQSKGVMQGLTRACSAADIAPSEIDAFSHAMTVSVNALLEENGAKTALITTEGFRDVLEIGRQDRPALYDLNADKPTPLVPRRRRFELGERATTEGIERPVDDSEIDRLVDTIVDSEIESVAVCLLHAYAHPDNEKRVAARLRERLDVPVSASHEVLAEFREYERSSTTVVDAYVRPPIERYLSRLEGRAVDAGVPTPRIMQSNGGIADSETVRKRAVTTVLSGPAAGVTSASAVETDKEGLITFDMGGTSSDVSLVREGGAEITTDAKIGGRPIGVPMVDVHTVGAGGGSIGWVDAGGALRVGPESAGAMPGPAAYGRGGTKPTVTDANLVLGYIGDDAELGGDLSLDAEAARTALDSLAAEAGVDGPLAAARGVYRIANANMTRAIRAVTVERGHDPRQFGLCAFGGAGPMHAAQMAETLGVDRVVVPYASGVRSAFGLLSADEKHDAAQTVRTPLSAVDSELIDETLSELRSDVLSRLGSGVDETAARVEYAADLRYSGQSFELTVPISRPVDIETVDSAFHAAHEQNSGYRMDDPVELVTLRATAVAEREPPAVVYEPEAPAQIGHREAFFDDEFVETPIYNRGEIAVDHSVGGPAIIEADESTTVVPPTWTATVSADGTLRLRREDSI
ncbi:N-methylhydantoinase A [Halohasta litchfieldiae]|uniref:N-methylhydantoinase A n=1 Tax=Halohasta litchfieldiae TaxID=1073996 RepID=A0A1H6RKU6_9EURY|nr:hydantoinase/oxoprolinase family protein [Halohasta litchfieldiae]ATW89806.1 N-methylhydantoinase A [Halohasta litchfieldiae]SEI52430.1 N-methylhydantoinase A [Halohasta litchfieldiae]